VILGSIVLRGGRRDFACGGRRRIVLDEFPRLAEVRFACIDAVRKKVAAHTTRSCTHILNSSDADCLRDGCRAPFVLRLVTW
jgi:hypothetical protein